jgi:hypothetical protein
METLIDIMGYGIIVVVIAGALYVFIRLLTTSLDTLTKHDD